MKNFWTFFVACFVFSFSFVATAQQKTDDPSTGSAAAEHIKNDGIMSCDDIKEKCDMGEAAPKKEVVKSSRWVECLIPPEIRIVSENGTYVTQKSPTPTWQVGQECTCPEGYSLSKSYRLRSKSEREGKAYESWDVAGVCLPHNTEPNAEIIAEGLNHLLDFMKRLDLMEKNTNDSISALVAIVGGHTEKIELNRQQVVMLREDVDALKTFMDKACDTPNLSPAWGKLCTDIKRMQEDIDDHLRNHWVLSAGAAMEIVRFPDNTYVGPALQLSLETPPIAGPMSLAFVGRLGTGRAEDIGADNSAGWAYKGAFVPSLLWHLDDNERAKLYTGFIAEQMYKPTGEDKDRGRRLGGEVAGVYCPMAELGRPASVCLGGFLNLAHGDSIFNRQPTAADPNPENRGASAITFGGGFTVTGQF